MRYFISILFILCLIPTCGGGGGGGGGGDESADNPLFPVNSKVLILHADDIGMCEEANIAVIPYLENQQIQSASVMMPCEYSDEFMQWYKANADYDIGLHLTLTSEWETWRWGTVADKDRVPSLLDSDGFMWHNVAEVVQNAKPEEVEKEIRAQIEKSFLLGVLPTHLDTHMATLYASDEFSEIYLDLAEEYQIPALVFNLSNESIIQTFDKLNLPITDALIARCNDYNLPKLDYFESIPHGNSYEEFKNNFFDVVRSLDSGIAIIVFHPSIESDELKINIPDWQQRVWESQIFSDPDVINFLKNEGVIFTNWRDLMKRMDL